MPSTAEVPLNPRSSPKKQLILQRAQALAEVRSFLDKKGACEVDCPILYSYPNLDAHIVPFSLQTDGQTRYLHTSPEFGIKRLLAEGIGDVYQLGHVFRSGELSPKHNPEFTMIEWYQLERSWLELAQGTVELINQVLAHSSGILPHRIRSYRELFLSFLQIDPFLATDEELYACCLAHQIHPYAPLKSISRDEILNLLLGIKVEPFLGSDNCIDLICNYPASQAALSKIVPDENGFLIGLRFECYFQGIELANGYEELTDAKEQKQRFIDGQKGSVNPLPIDPRFLAALEKGLPPCSGVAIGFDRLLMLRLQKSDIGEILPLNWGEA